VKYLSKKTNVLLKPKQPPFVSQQVTSARRFYLNLKPTTTRDLTVVCGGWEKCAVNYAIDRASFPYLSLEFVADGTGDLVLAGKGYVLKPGTIFTYGPGISQSIHTSSKDRLSKYFVDFCGRRAEQLLVKNNLSPGSVLTIRPTTEVRDAFESLISLASNYDNYSERAAILQIELLIIVITRAAQPLKKTERRALATFERCCSHLEYNFRTIHTVDDLALACSVEVSYLFRLFRRFHRESPFQYLQRLQMQWAAQQLETTGCLVRQVADDLNIDPFQFSRTFKRIYGVSPTLFLSSRG
jgi:AraC-like DNA-binding protein